MAKLVRTFTIDAQEFKDELVGDVLSRFMYLKTKKTWKLIFRLGEEWVWISPQGKEKPFYKEAYYYSNYSFTEDTIYEAFFEEMTKKVPALKYWVKKLREQGCPCFSYLSVLLKYKDIPETESLILATRMNACHDALCIPALQVLGNTNKWLKEKRKKEIINAYRLYVQKRNEDDDFMRTFHLFNYQYLANLTSVMYDKDAYLKISRGNLQITDSDLRWLRSLYGDDIDISLVREYMDWLYEYSSYCTDITDNYFRHNKKWRKLHQKSIKDHERYIRLNHLRAFLGLEPIDYTDKKEIQLFQKRYKKYNSYELVKGDLRCYISDDINKWKYRAKKLRQCIISASYYAKKECILVFIDRKGEPAYTAEILKNNSIGQFMGDERNLSTCRNIPEDATSLLKEFLEMYSIL